MADGPIKTKDILELTTQIVVATCSKERVYSTNEVKEMICDTAAALREAATNDFQTKPSGSAKPDE